jgi:LuxR family maltose regulon positive regulatory protein
MRQLNRVPSVMATGPASAETVPLRLGAALIAAVAAAKLYDGPRAARAAESLEALIAQAAPAQVAAHPEMRTIMLLARGTAQSRAGALADAVATLAEAAEGVLPAGCENIRITCLAQLAFAYAYQGRLQEAGDTAGRVAQLAGQRLHTPSCASLAGSAVLAWVAAERWIVATAWRHLRAAETIITEADPAGIDPMATVAVALVRSRLLSGRGELRSAARALDEVQPAAAGLPWLDQEVSLSRAALTVAMGSPDEALVMVRTLGVNESPQAAIVHATALVVGGDAQRASEVVQAVVEMKGLPMPLQIEGWLILAIVAGERGEAATVRHALGQALSLAAADGHRRVFHQAGPWLRHLLRGDAELAAAYEALGASTPGKAPVRMVGARAAIDAPIVVDPLSERELQVLTHLAAMLGTEEIADAMYLSVNTVKTHVRSILRKLAASRRNEAVRRAKALGIV